MQTHQLHGHLPAFPARRLINGLLSSKSALLAALLLAAPLVASAQLEPVEAASAPPALLLADAAPSVELAAPAISSSSSLDNPGTLLDDLSASPDSASPDFASPDLDAPTPAPKPHKQTPESEVAVEGFYSYGNWQIFAAGFDESLWTGGFEYDRHSWGEFIGAQMDYVAEFLPFVLLREPKYLNPYGVRQGPKQDVDYLHGLGFSPIGLRMEWRHNKAFKPYFNVKGGAIGFTQKALSPDASYYDFSLQESIGFYLRMSQRLDMRFGLFGDYHFSNAYITSFNPGLDVMNSNLALSYHFGGDQSPH